MRRKRLRPSAGAGAFGIPRKSEYAARDGGL